MTETKVTGYELKDDESTSESNTGRKWINGQVIWKKTIAATGSLSGNLNFPHGVSGITAIVKF